MTQATHTPGPWKASAHIVYAGEFRVATVQAVGVRANRDAELIAAAPDMLEILRCVESMADYAKDNPRSQTGALFDILDATRAVIAKATGDDHP